MLEKFLDAKPLYYDEIDYSRMPRVYEKIKKHLWLPKIIHLIGTNGKGTTGRFLASSLHSIGFKTGHYTSPHILNFNERIWLDGKEVNEAILNNAHAELLNLLSEEDADSLSYFEYTTLLSMIVYKDCDYVVLEAGLGGEHDATAVFEKELTLVTPIDFDHEAFLGNTLKEIATTKLNAVEKNAIIGSQKFDEVYQIANDLDAEVYRVDEFIDTSDIIKINAVSEELSLPHYLQENLKLAVSALNFLGMNYQKSDFSNGRLFGRLSRLNDNIYLDVGHNTLAASTILNSLSGKKYILVYNSYRDKNYREILRILKPIVERVEILPVCDGRIELEEKLHAALNELKIGYSSFKEIKDDKFYLVFGSFSVAEAFLKVYNE